MACGMPFMALSMCLREVPFNNQWALRLFPGVLVGEVERIRVITPIRNKHWYVSIYSL